MDVWHKPFFAFVAQGRIIVHAHSNITTSPKYATLGRKSELLNNMVSMWDVQLHS